MTDPQLNDLRTIIHRLAEGLEVVRTGAARLQEFGNRVGEIVQAVAAPLESTLLKNRIATYFTTPDALSELGNRLSAAVQGVIESHMLISATLPQRGWYLSGTEPCTLSITLARAVKKQDWQGVDDEMMQHLPVFNIEKLTEWLNQESVPGYCANRIRKFVQHHDAGNYEEATYLGVPVIDELAQALYRGKAFTTKRSNRRKGDQSKPELAFKTASGPELKQYSLDFLSAFGSLQEDPDPDKLADECYWNRSAIVHGLMKRAMGIKDSAKCLMAINFLIYARKAPEPTPAEQVAEIERELLGE